MGLSNPPQTPHWFRPRSPHPAAYGRGCPDKYRQCLGLSTREHSRAVRPGQYADFNVDRPNLLELARVRPAALVRDLRAENLLAKNIEVLGEFLPPALIFLGDRILEVGL